MSDDERVSFVPGPLPEPGPEAVTIHGFVHDLTPEEAEDIKARFRAAQGKGALPVWLPSELWDATTVKPRRRWWDPSTWRNR